MQIVAKIDSKMDELKSTSAELKETLNDLKGYRDWATKRPTQNNNDDEEMIVVDSNQNDVSYYSSDYNHFPFLFFLVYLNILSESGELT